MPLLPPQGVTIASKQATLTIAATDTEYTTELPVFNLPKLVFWFYQSDALTTPAEVQIEFGAREATGQKNLDFKPIIPPFLLLPGQPTYVDVYMPAAYMIRAGVTSTAAAGDTTVAYVISAGPIG